VDFCCAMAGTGANVTMAKSKKARLHMPDLSMVALL
jgi:hypothetical protein